MALCGERHVFPILTGEDPIEERAPSGFLLAALAIPALLSHGRSKLCRSITIRTMPAAPFI